MGCAQKVNFTTIAAIFQLLLLFSVCDLCDSYTKYVASLASNNSLDTNAMSQNTSSPPKGLLYHLYGALFSLTRKVRPHRIITVSHGGHADSGTIQGAVDMVPENNLMRVIIKISPGIYREKIVVPKLKPFITFQGSGSQKTIITWNDKAADIGLDGQILGTFGSASVAVDADCFIARDISFVNTAAAALPGAQGMQAVALRISGDKAAFVDCRMLGSQDTLFDHLGRHLFLRCYIQGAIDFIFGDGRSLYMKCELHANAATYGAIAASQRSSLNENTGFSFVQCKLTGSGLLYLGRAWGPYARVVFAYSYFENVVLPQGWSDWGDASRRRTVFFGEYRCSGPGAKAGARAPWGMQLTFQQVRPFLGIGFINGHKWLHDLVD